MLIHRIKRLRLQLNPIIVSLFLMLSGCQSFFPEKMTPLDQPLDMSQPPTNTNESIPTAQTETSQVVTMADPVDWPATLSLLINQLQQAVSLSSPQHRVMIDEIKNDSGMRLNLTQLTSVLYDQLISTDQFSLVDVAAIQQANRALVQSQQDSLKTRAKSVAVARHLQASLILFTTISGNLDSPEITMQLMQINSGELLWSATGEIIRQKAKK